MRSPTREGRRRDRALGERLLEVVAFSRSEAELHTPTEAKRAALVGLADQQAPSMVAIRLRPSAITNSRTRQCFVFTHAIDRSPHR
jgi:hypothetical protein